MAKRRIVKKSRPKVKRLKLSLNPSNPKAAKIKEVALPVSGIVRVVIPEGVAPTIIADPAKSIVEIVPVPVKKTWWQSVFG